MMRKIEMAVVDDHRIVREGILSLFEGHNEISITGGYDNGSTLLNAMQQGSKYDIILLDMHMPKLNGINTAAEVIKHYPATRILVHTMSEMAHEIEQIVKIGAHGYILKTAALEDLEIAIKVVAHGGSYFSTSVMNSFIQACIGKNENPVNSLSQVQIQVLRLYCEEEQSMFEIGKAIGITEQEVKAHIAGIKRLLEVKTDIGLGKFYAANSKDLWAGVQ